MAFKFISKNPHDLNYPYTISGAWGGEVSLTKEDLAVLKKELEEVLKQDG